MTESTEAPKAPVIKADMEELEEAMRDVVDQIGRAHV